MKNTAKTQRGRESSESIIKNIVIINRTEREEIVCPKYSSIASKWKQSATSSELNINTVKNKKKNKITSNRLETNKTLRNIDKFNIKRYDKNI